VLEARALGTGCGFFIFEHLVIRKLGEADPLELGKGEERMARYAPVLKAHLKGRACWCGGAVTLADFAIGSYLAEALSDQQQVSPAISQFARPSPVRWRAGKRPVKSRSKVTGCSERN
jgi:hypothetical protein